MTREEAIKILKAIRVYECYPKSASEETKEAIDMAIEALSAEAVQRWIPVSESLPDADDCPMDCVVTRKSKFVGNYVDIAVAEKNGTWTHEDWNAIVIDEKAKCISTRDADIIAWMPLPTPYKGGDSE